MDAYQSGIDGQLFIWIDQQKDVSNVSLQQSTGRKTHLSHRQLSNSSDNKKLIRHHETFIHWV